MLDNIAVIYESSVGTHSHSQKKNASLKTFIIVTAEKFKYQLKKNIERGEFCRESQPDENYKLQNSSRVGEN